MAALHDVIGIILGGGRGERLYPLTKLRTKPAVPLAGKFRLIDIPISNCINSGIDRIYVLTQYLSASLLRHVNETYKFDVFSHGYVDILPAEQTLTSTSWYQGTADAVRRQLHHFHSHKSKDAIILAGDHLYRMDYSKFVQFHRDNNADLTVAALPTPAHEVHRFGVLRADDDGRITRFREKPRTPDQLEGLMSLPGTDRPYLGSMGIYVFRLDTMVRLLEEVKGDDFGKHIIPAAMEQCRVFAYPFQGYWEDIGTIESFYRTNLALTRRDPPFSFYDPRHPIFTRPRFLPSSHLDNCHFHHVVVSDGCQVHNARAVDSIIGLRSIIRPGVYLQSVIMMGSDDYEDEEDRAENARLGRPDLGIGNDSHIVNAIIDKDAHIGRNVVIRPHLGEPDRDEESWSIRDGIVVIPKNAIIPEGTII